MNVPQTMVAIMTLASEHAEVSEEEYNELAALLKDATRMELLVLLASLANVNNFALGLLEQSTQLSKDKFLRELGVDFLKEDSE